MTDQEYLKLTEVAALFRVDPRTIRYWLQKGGILPVPIRLSRKVRLFNRAAVLALLSV